MTRLLPALITWISFVSVGMAALTPPRDMPTFGREVPEARIAKVSVQTLERTAGVGTRSEYMMTERTEVQLNGKACKYADVPASARIVRMEVAADQKTILKIHFRTGK